ncbi:MAG: hypothetical protein PHE26_04750 [Syntrophomonadaceae bacterium]|nr:hypothetical protein [Syntrophomonadaceae bacterium]
MFPVLFPRMGKVAKDEPWSTLGWGFLAIMLIPLSALLLMITVVGIPLALLFLLVYVIVLLIAKIIAADFLARCLSNYFKWEGRIPFILPFMLAFTALILLARIPILGFIINLIAASLALGMLVLTFYRWRIQSPEVQN